MLTKTKLALSALLLLGTASVASAESWDYIPGERNPQPVVTVPQGPLQGRSAYEGRAQVDVQASTFEVQPPGPRSNPSIYGGGF